MVIVGLTGSIAMGKSTVAGMFVAFGVPVFDADEAVRAFYAGPGAKAVEANFPGTIGPEGIDREKLARRVLGDKEGLERLEALVHPEVAKARLKFLSLSREDGRKVCVLDVPLLIETGGHDSVDLVAVVSAPLDVQRARALGRPGMTGAKFDQIVARQAPDLDKRRRAHVVICTGGAIDETRAQVRQLLRAVSMMEGRRHA